MTKRKKKHIRRSDRQRNLACGEDEGTRQARVEYHSYFHLNKNQKRDEAGITTITTVQAVQHWNVIWTAIVLYSKPDIKRY